MVSEEEVISGRNLMLKVTYKYFKGRETGNPKARC